MVAYSVTAVICPSALARQHASQPEDARHAQAQNQPYRRIDDGKHAAQADHGIGIVAKGLVRALFLPLLVAESADDAGAGDVLPHHKVDAIQFLLHDLGEGRRGLDHPGAEEEQHRQTGQQHQRQLTAGPDGHDHRRDDQQRSGEDHLDGHGDIGLHVGNIGGGAGDHGGQPQRAELPDA